MSYTYDSVGRVASMTDGAGTETYGYDAGGRLITVTRGTATYSYGYDAAGNVTSRTYPDGTVITSGFDDDGRLASVTSAGKTTSYTYDPAGNLTSTALPNGVTRSVSFDRAGRVTTLNSTAGTNPIAGYTYTRDANGLPTSIVATGANVAGTRQFTYDTANRLTSVCYVAGTCPAASLTAWTYDTVGNRLSEKIGTGAATTYTYDNADQLISAVVGTVTTAYGYDANGNQTTAGNRVNSYNTAGQTVSIKDGTNPATAYSYDGNGNRLTATTGASVTRLNWDTNNPLPMLATETNSAGTLLRRYTYGNGDPISVTTPTATSFYVGDELGSTTHVTNSTGGVQWAYTYTPFGTTRSGVKVDPAGPDNPIKYTGQYEDPTGNYNLRARLYNPTLGSFTQTDPLNVMVSNGGYESAYVYGSNRPTVLVDPSGLRSVDPKAAAVDVLHEKDRTTAHNVLVNIEFAYCTARGERCAKGLTVPGGSKKGTGNDGFADLVHFTDTGAVEVAEVKAWSQMAKVLVEATWYASTLGSGRLASTWDARVWSTAGGYVAGGRGYTYTAVPGGFVYRELKTPMPRPIGVPVEVPEPVPQPNRVPKPVVVAGGAAAGAGLLWWLGKLASPACGPAVVVCAVVL